jgi:hypothetical protein
MTKRNTIIASPAPMVMKIPGKEKDERATAKETMGSYMQVLN